MSGAAGEYDLSIGRFIADFPAWMITAGTGGYGFAAQLRDGHGRGRGQKFTALTLDQLAEILRREEPRS